MIPLQPSDPCPECCEADGNTLCDVAYCTHGCHKPPIPGEPTKHFCRACWSVSCEHCANLEVAAGGKA